MSSDVLSRAKAFSAKASELCSKGHLLRAAENYGRAAEAARALGEDNLVTLSMQLRQSNVLRGHAWAAAENATDADPRILATHRADGVALLFGAVEALERRRAADTMLEGKCTKVEEAWFIFRWQEIGGSSAADAASFAALVGYEQFMSGAMDAAKVLGCEQAHQNCSYAQLEFFAQHVVHAAELLQQPRRHNKVGLHIEAMFTDKFCDAVAGGVNGLNVRLRQLLTDALQRLLRSGVLRSRGIQPGKVVHASGYHAFKAAVRTSVSAPDRRSCALPGCGAKEAHPAHFKSCAACRTVVYCCREHQVAGWPAHKKACKAARKAAAADDDDAAGPSGA